MLLALVGSASFILLMSWHPPQTVTLTDRSQTQGLLRVGMTSFVTATLLVVPGLVVRSRIPGLARLQVGVVPLTGLALIATVGSLGWSAAPVHAVAVDRVGVLLILVSLTVWSRGASPRLDRGELRALGIAFLVYLVALGRSLWSLGPDGELYAGQISRTLEVGDRPDSRISYHVSSVIANGLDPFNGAGAQLFAPYSFLDRGPLPGLVSTPVMLAVGTHPTIGLPDQPWSVFDTQGFMTYRIVMMLLATLSILAVFTITRALGGRGRADLAALVAGGTPFLVHETWFTWPKLAAASMILLAAYELVRGRSLRAGLLAGVGYLFHPLALLAVPTLALFVMVRGRLSSSGDAARTAPVRGWRWLRDVTMSGALLALGLVIVAGGWLELNHAHHGTGGFLSYFTEAETQPNASLHAWLASRLISLGNTLVPFFLFREPTNHSVNSIYAPSGTVVHFFFQYWVGLAFGGALVFYPVLLWGLGRASRREPVAVAAVVGIPLLLFAVYWGSYDSGLLREGLHPWVLTVVVVWALAWSAGPVGRWLRVVLALRVVEVGLDTVAPSAWFHRGLTAPDHELGDSVAIAIVLSALLGLVFMTLRVLRSAVLAPRPYASEAGVRDSILSEPRP